MTFLYFTKINKVLGLGDSFGNAVTGNCNGNNSITKIFILK